MLHSRDGRGGRTKVLSEQMRELTFQRFRVVATSGPNQGAEKASESSEFSIGTAPANHLVLTDPTVSSHHCVITATPRGFLLRDLDSTNGTRLGGYRVALAYLKPGAVLGLGDTALRFDALDEEIHEPLSAENRFGKVLGRSAAMRRIFALLPKIAGSDVTLLIEGETGTGKTFLAQAVHERSPRAKRPFVVVDCGSIPPTLIESVLFGHEKGSFTGAQSARTGAFESAQGGTVFLDEIGELPLAMQPKLLRVLEERTVSRIGSVEPIRLDVRVIAASNRDLREMVNRGDFRSDLYYRLNIVRLRVPPLRERPDDVRLLVTHFYKQFTQAEGAEKAGATPPRELMLAFSRMAWPGNVRELRNAVQRAVLLEDPDLLAEMTNGDALVGSGVEGANGAPRDHGAVIDQFDPNASFRAAKESSMGRWERWYLGELMQRNGGNLSRAARAARMNRAHLRSLLRKYNLSGRSAADSAAD